MLTSTYSNDLLWYDARGYYTIEGSYADPGFAAVFGRELAKDNQFANNNLPTEYKVDNDPNPFNPTTLIKYQIPEAGLVKLIVYDLLGKEISVLVNETEKSGYHSVEFNARNLPSGVYIYTLQVNDFISSKKMTVIK